MNKKLIVSIILVSLCCLTIASALSFEEVINNIIINPFNSLFGGKPISFTGKLTSVTGKSTSVVIGDLVRVPGDLISCKLYKHPTTGFGTPSFDDLIEVADYNDCSKLFDDDDFTKVSLEDKGAGTHDVDPAYGGEAGVSVESGAYTLILTFPKVSVNRIAIIPGISLSSNDMWVKSGGREGTTVKFFSMYEPTVRGNGLAVLDAAAEADTIIYTFKSGLYSPPGIKDFLDEIIILYEGIPSICYDTDGGEDIYLGGTTTRAFDSKTDECWSLNLATTHGERGDLTHFLAPNGCNRGDLVPGGYMDGCLVNEAYCENGVVKQKLIPCPDAAPACYDGECACLYDEQCPDGYECRLARPDDQQNTRRICQKLPGTQDPTPPSQPICEDTDQGNEPYLYGSLSFGTGYRQHEDQCIFVSPDSNIKEVISCENGKYTGEDGFVLHAPGKCHVTEHYCNDGLHILESFECSTECNSGACICNINDECPDDYECTNGLCIEITPTQVCTPGDTQDCATTDGYSGTQTCTSDGVWGDCITTESCGDGIINGPEVCDGIDLADETCVTKGFDAGDLDCYAAGTAEECTFDTSGCTTGAGCTDECNEGEIGCNDDNTKSWTCELGADDCFHKVFTDCGANEVCDPTTHTCLPPSAGCTDECAQGETGCSDDNTQSWICELGTDGCHDKVFTDCATGETCDPTTHACVPEQPTGPYAGLGEDCTTLDCYTGLYCDATESVCKKCELATDCANADCEQIRILDTDNDGIDEYCEAGTNHNLIQSGEDCDYDYQCQDNICHTNGKCLSFDGLRQAYCYIKEQLGQTDDAGYLEFCVE